MLPFAVIKVKAEVLNSVWAEKVIVCHFNQIYSWSHNQLKPQEVEINLVLDHVQKLKLKDWKKDDIEEIKNWKEKVKKIKLF